MDRRRADSECNMNLFFTRHDIKSRGRGLSFDDVLLVPHHSEIASRRQPQLNSPLSKNFSLRIPVVASNMDTITEEAMACALAELGGLGILHRFMTAEEQIRQIRIIREFITHNKLNIPVAASIGVKAEGMERADLLAEEGVQILTIDIAHGDSIMMLETLSHVRKKYPKIDVIAGNVATAEATARLINAGASAVKVGIGPGSMCTTRLITGHGLPQLTAIALCAEVAEKQDTPVIADGGIRNSGDIVKALAAGASCVMLGSMLSGTLETPGDVKGGQKAYRGMASKDAQVSWRGELPEGMAAEGEATLVPCKGSVKNVIHEICGGIRSGMSYAGVERIMDLRDVAQFIEMSAAGTAESRAHGVR